MRWFKALSDRSGVVGKSVESAVSCAKHEARRKGSPVADMEEKGSSCSGKKKCLSFVKKKGNREIDFVITKCHILLHDEGAFEEISEKNLPVELL